MDILLNDEQTQMSVQRSSMFYGNLAQYEHTI